MLNEVVDYHTDPVHMEEYLKLGKVTEFNYGNWLACLRGRNFACLDGFGRVRQCWTLYECSTECNVRRILGVLHILHFDFKEHFPDSYYNYQGGAIIDLNY